MAAEMDNSPRGILEFQINRKIINLAKNFLCQIEDLISDGWIIPEDRYKRIRKRTLDDCNNSYREIQSSLEKFDIDLKN